MKFGLLLFPTVLLLYLTNKYRASFSGIDDTVLFFSSLSNTCSICKCAFVKVEAIIEGGIVFFFKE